MIRTKELIGMLAAAALVFSSCLKTEEFPDEPHIEFKSFTVDDDSASVVVYFTDGDGDIGLRPGDTLAPYDQEPFNFNLLLHYQELQDGEWNDVQLGASTYIGYRIPIISPTGQNKTLEGEIAVRMQPFNLFHQPTADTIRYGVTLIDRALHQSNRVYTDSKVVQ